MKRSHDFNFEIIINPKTKRCLCLKLDKVPREGIAPKVPDFSKESVFNTTRQPYSSVRAILFDNLEILSLRSDKSKLY